MSTVCHHCGVPERATEKKPIEQVWNALRVIFTEEPKFRLNVDKMAALCGRTGSELLTDLMVYSVDGRAIMLTLPAHTIIGIRDPEM